MSVDSFVKVSVGGIPYTIAVSDIEKHPGSFFECMIKKEWLKDPDTVITIDRDGSVFKFVNAFLVFDQLPRDQFGQIKLSDEILTALKVEADFYGVSALSNECDLPLKARAPDIHNYQTIRKYIEKMKHHPGNGLQVECGGSKCSKVVRALKRVWAPFCLSKRFSGYYLSQKIYKNSSVKQLNIPELIKAAKQSPFGRGTETVTDTSVRNSFEIDASQLDAAGLNECLSEIDVSKLAPQLTLTLRPYKLVIYQKGGHFHEHRDTVRGEGHIGTLVVILNSKYTGGELEVSHGGQTMVVTGAYNWVAMYGDCLHKINPVTSGTRVSLIYDIYAENTLDVEVSNDTAIEDKDEGVHIDGEEEEEDEEDEEDEEEYHHDEFWETRNEPNSQTAILAMDEADKRRVVKAVGGELAAFDSIIISLQHLYPECQANPSFLKGGDRYLYEILHEHYDVQVVAATIYRYNPCERNHLVTAALFSPSVVAKTLAEEAGAGASHYYKKQKKSDPDSEKTKIILAPTLWNVLDYTPYIEHTGNESQAERTVYIVAGLQVRKRA